MARFFFNVYDGYLVRSHWIDVVDAQREAVLQVRFGDAVDIHE